MHLYLQIFFPLLFLLYKPNSSQDLSTYFKQKAKKEIEKLTAMNVVRLEVIAKSVYVPEKKEEK